MLAFVAFIGEQLAAIEQSLPQAERTPLPSLETATPTCTALNDAAKQPAAAGAVLLNATPATAATVPPAAATTPTHAAGGAALLNATPATAATVPLTAHAASVLPATLLATVSAVPHAAPSAMSIDADDSAQLPTGAFDEDAAFPLSIDAARHAAAGLRYSESVLTAKQA